MNIPNNQFLLNPTEHNIAESSVTVVKQINGIANNKNNLLSQGNGTFGSVSRQYRYNNKTKTYEIPEDRLSVIIAIDINLNRG